MSPTTTSRCHAVADAAPLARQGSIVLVGQPNVGKSVLFQWLTGRYVNVSNFPGTTVEISRGSARSLPQTGVVDTPGVVSIPARGEDEEVTTRVLLEEPVRALVQVGDGKSLRRTLLLSVQLAELGLPMVLALNMMDEAEARGLGVDCELLSRRLGIAVQPTVATRGNGVAALLEAISAARPGRCRLRYPEPVEAALARVLPLLPPADPAPRALGLLWLSGDRPTERWLAERLPAGDLERLGAIREGLAAALESTVSAAIQVARIAHVEELLVGVLSERGGRSSRTVWLARLTTHPLWGWPILALVLYGMYEFVGILGAGTLVGVFEEDLFGKLLNPWLTDLVQRLVPVPLLAEFLVGEYGLWTMGMTYALALILPIVTTFFLAFSLLEDSGYLSRLTVLCNRLFNRVGLNGKAVLPMVLGLGCVTMATLTTRILDTRRDRLLATLLLALAIPCSAQLGVILGMLGSLSLAATLIWAGVLLAVLVAVGALAARLVPGERSTLLVELPPLRLPVASNVAVKTLARLEWYVREVVPLFLIGTALLFALEKTGALTALIAAAEPLVSGWLGLPRTASAAFLVGFMRRDFGATGLFVMHQHGQLSAEQIVVAMVTITLFIPCVASVLIIARERGMRTAVGMTAMVFPVAFLVGGVLHRVLLLAGWNG
ncbi:MAG TPA: ferrous iron transport protein B [Solirubrobacterales bacterium]|nr:ferrous iron transport protein B [Solirubrobacterales bacterium]